MSSPLPKKLDGFAANLFDRIEKLRKLDTPAPTVSNSSPTSPQKSFTTSNLFNNLSMTFNKTRDKVESSTPAESNSLLVIDDVEFDDPPQEDPIENNQKIFSPEETRSRHSSSSSSANRPELQLNTSLSDYELNKRSDSDPTTQTLSKASDSLSTSKLSSSSSLYKLGSQVFDDFVARNNPAITSVVDEAGNLKKRLLAKKKSIENNLVLTKSPKVKTSVSSSLVSNAISTPVLATSQTQVDLEKRTINAQISAPLPLTSSLDLVADTKTDNEMLSEKECAKVDLVDESLNAELTDKTELSSDNQSELTQRRKASNVEMKIDANVQVNKAKEKMTPIDLVKDQLVKHKHLALSLCVLFIAYFVLLPRQWHYFMISYTWGMLNGIALTALVVYFLFKMDLLVYIVARLTGSTATKNDQQEAIEDSEKNTKKETDANLLHEQIHSLLIQSAIFKGNKNFDGVYKGWMNELREKYSPDNYFLNKTRSVYINLDGNTLRLQTTNSRVPKRAVCNEKVDVNSFNKLRIYDLTECQVQILPTELCRKRYWSKKYPLCLSGVKLLSSSTNQYKPIQTGSASVYSIKSTSSMNNVKTSIVKSLSSNKVADNTDAPMIDSPRSELKLTNSSSFDNKLEPDTLILFARTDREKEEWFKLFKKSAAKSLQDSNYFIKLNKEKQSLSEKFSIVSNNIDMNAIKVNELRNLSYNATRDKIIYKLDDPITLPGSISSTPLSPAKLSSQVQISTHCESDTQTENGLIYDSSLAFMNTFIIRLFADFFTHQYWIDKIQTKIQNKLNTIKLPYFMESLNIINLGLGSVVPLIKQASEPWYDEKGLWVHLDIDYSGGVEILISTKLNLMKLKVNGSLASPTNSTGQIGNPMFTFKNDQEPTIVSSLSNKQQAGEMTDKELNKSFQSYESDNISSNEQSRRAHLAIIESEAEDSPESSGDEYTHDDFNTESETTTDGNKLVETAATSKKLLNFVSKIAASNYFQKATDNKYIKMAMENVSNCQLNLNVEVKKISGKIALNIPPHPSDRIWYGFIEKPDMTLVATPQVGEKEVSYVSISDWIADKLKQEFQKVLVFPNMDDFYIPILNSEVNYQNW